MQFCEISDITTLYILIHITPFHYAVSSNHCQMDEFIFSHRVVRRGIFTFLFFNQFSKKRSEVNSTLIRRLVLLRLISVSTVSYPKDIQIILGENMSKWGMDAVILP